jgi:polyphosphate kinase
VPARAGPADKRSGDGPGEADLGPNQDRDGTAPADRNAATRLSLPAPDRSSTTPSPAAAEAVDHPFLNRELSWLEFNARVLFEASDPRNPLLERVRFLAIYADNLDEFFAVRVAGLHQQVQAGTAGVSPDGMTPGDQLAAIRRRLERLLAEQDRVFAGLMTDLAAAGIRIASYVDVTEHHAALRERFMREIFPVLTPLAVDPGHPFPYISTLSLSLAVGLRDRRGAERFARVKVPAVLPRFLDLGDSTFVPIEQVIAANLDALFSGMEVVETYLFRVTRNTDIALEEDEADDLLLAIEEELRRRRFGAAVRLEVEPAMPRRMRSRLIAGIRLRPEDVFEANGLLDLAALSQIAAIERPDLHNPPWTPTVPARLAPSEDEPVDIFAAIRERDILVHHPYESFDASVGEFISQAVDDPDVLAIKQTLYRTGGDSPIVHELIRAAEQGKQVVVLVEIKARFDEQANIVWARKLEQAGAHVVYGLVGLKTHAKVVLVIRREASGLRRYVHVGTGNYNPRTARQYVDLGLLSCRPDLGADATDLFNVLTGYSRQQSFRSLLIAPLTLRRRMLELIERETEHRLAGREAGIVIKLNALVDPAFIDALYRASQNGVDVDIFARSICALRPGIAGLSDRIRVRSIVGPYLEHSRIYGFANGGSREWYIGSADLMERNLDRRVEALVPIEDGEARSRIAAVIEALRADDRRSWELGADGEWRRVEDINGRPGTVDEFEVLKVAASASAGAFHASSETLIPSGRDLEERAESRRRADAARYSTRTPLRSSAGGG